MINNSVSDVNVVSDIRVIIIGVINQAMSDLDKKFQEPNYELSERNFKRRIRDMRADHKRRMSAVDFLTGKRFLEMVEILNHLGMDKASLRKLKVIVNSKIEALAQSYELPA